MKKTFYAILVAGLIFTHSRHARAEEWSPQHFSFEFKPGFFLPQGSDFEQVFGDCCNVFYPVTFGYLLKSRYNFDIGVGFFTREGKAVGATSGSSSGDDFRLMLIPVSNTFTYRAAFKDDQLAIPYAGVGFDYVYARENFQGTITEFWKVGYHANAGVQISTDGLGEDNLDTDLGINHIYILMEGKYSRIDDFGGGGLDLSGWTFSTGFLLEF